MDFGLRAAGRLLCVLALFVATSSIPALADPPPRGFIFNGHNHHDPVIEDGVVTFQVFEGQCSEIEYPDGRGESDCGGGEVRSSLWSSPWTPINQTVEYVFDIRVDESVKYEGYESNFVLDLLPNKIDSALWIAAWEGNRLHNYLYQLKADTKNGIAFLGRTCQPASALGQWVSVSLRAKWTNDDKGWMQVRCDGALIYATEGVATAEAPHCYGPNQCEPGVIKHPTEVGMHIGAFVSGFGPTFADRDLPSPFRDIQDDGILLQAKNIEIRKDPKPYTDEQKAQVKLLQQRLAELGCDQGPADGISGKKTRDAALTCRQFAEGVLPEAFNVMTLDTFVALYSDPATADLPRPPAPGELVTVAVDLDLRAQETFSDGKDADRGVYSEIRAEFPGKRVVEFALDGRYYSSKSGMIGLRMIFPDDVGDEGSGLSKCGATVEPWPGNKTGRAIVPITRSGSTFRIANVDCIIAAMPKAIAPKFEMVATNMDDIAVGIAKGKKLDAILHDGMRQFWTELATGATTLEALR